ncbi:MAG: response regulator [Candidatus Pacebacteria bacterium]|nr:response regulator [Candidatus Paceibacterota bacterium]
MENSKKQTILVVEDEPIMRQTLADNLASEGFDVLQAMDGVEGLEVAFSGHPDLILLDIMMPRMDGLTMMQKLRAKDVWGRKVPVILLTNLSPDEERVMKRIIEDEPAYCLVKTDWRIGDVIEKIKERLGRPED